MMEADYDLPKHNASDEEIQNILQSMKRVAVVGLSRYHEKDSYRVASYLKERGYQIIPVNPQVQEILNEKSYFHLEDIPEEIDIVNIFRKTEDVGEVVESAIAVGAKVIWMQERIVNNVAADRALEAGLKVVMDKCMMKEHRKYKIDTSL